MRLAFLGALGAVWVSAASAEVSLIEVPAACGPSDEVAALLAARMHDPTTVGKGRDSHGKEVAVLLAGVEYWALLATVAPGRVCIVASGRKWLDMNLMSKSY